MVDGESAVTSVPVTPGPVDGGIVAVEGKLEPGNRVVTDGADKLRDGAKVEVIAANAPAATPASSDKTPGARGKRRPEGTPAAAAN